MRKLLFLAAIGFGIWYSTAGEFSFTSNAGAFDEEGNPVVWLFTVKNCGKYCQTMRKDLKSRRVRFEEIVINPNDDADPNVALWKSVGKGGFPLTVAGNERMVGSGSKVMLQDLLGSSFGDKYLTSSEKKLYRQHFYSDGSPRIVLYGADWCPSCKKLRAEFEGNGIDYHEIDVDKSAYKKRITETLEVYGYPAVWVGYKRVKGTNLKAVRKTLNSI